MTYVKLQNTNELLHRHQTQRERSLDELTQRRDISSRDYGLKQLKFIAVLPKHCLTAAAASVGIAATAVAALSRIKLEICFFLIGRDLEPTPLRVNKDASSINFQLHTVAAAAAATDNESYYLYECNCEIPHFHDDSTRVIYFYCLRNEENQSVIGHESLLVNFNQTRSFAPPAKESRLASATSSHTFFGHDAAFGEQLDGLVLFNQTDTGFIHKWCWQTLSVFMRLDFLFSRSLNKEMHSNLIQRLHNVYRQLVPNSNEYRSSFNEVSLD